MIGIALWWNKIHRSFAREHYLEVRADVGTPQVAVGSPIKLVSRDG